MAFHTLVLYLVPSSHGERNHVARPNGQYCTNLVRYMWVPIYSPLCRQNYLTADNILAGRLEMGAVFGVTASTVAIARRVYRVTTDRSRIIEASLHVRIAHH